MQQRMKTLLQVLYLDSLLQVTLLGKELRLYMECSGRCHHHLPLLLLLLRMRTNETIIIQDC